MSRPLIMRTLVVTAAMMAASWLAWWGVAATAAIFGAMTARDRGGPVVSGLAAAIAWTIWLVVGAAMGPVGTVATTLGGVLQVRPVAVYVLTVAYAALISVCAAIVARSLARTIRPTPSAP